ncbi:MAG: DM13 domain-containing protein [Calothrix sp. SM1_7_51]|nr:DM13 domain-containing protein [Calothrix sp. SM1_7_51]
MKSKYAAVLSIITLLNFSNIEAAFSKQTVNQNQPRNIVTQVAAKTGATGSFRAGEHPTQGNVRIITERGKRYLEFDKSFKTDNGPDLFVVLYRNQTVPVSGIKEKDYKSIARLQKLKVLNAMLSPTM